MSTIIIILALLASILLILIVLIQNPKGGGISSSFSSANQIVGVKRTNDLVEKLTWTFAIVLLLTAFSSSYFSNTSSDKESLLKDRLNNMPITPDNPGDVNMDGIPQGGAQEEVTE
jgi:preprotein translocase subunit SecG